MLIEALDLIPYKRFIVMGSAAGAIAGAGAVWAGQFTAWIAGGLVAASAAATTGIVIGAIAGLGLGIAGLAAISLLSAYNDMRNLGQSSEGWAPLVTLGASILAAGALTASWMTGSFSMEFNQQAACKPSEATLENGTVVVFVGVNCPNAPKQQN